MPTQHKQRRGTENLTSCPIRSSDDRLPMLTFRLSRRELQPKEGRKAEGECESLRGGVRDDANRGKAQGLECEAPALRLGQLNREYIRL